MTPEVKASGVCFICVFLFLLFLSEDTWEPECDDIQEICICLLGCSFYCTIQRGDDGFAEGHAHYDVLVAVFIVLTGFISLVRQYCLDKLSKYK